MSQLPTKYGVMNSAMILLFELSITTACRYSSVKLKSHVTLQHGIPHTKDNMTFGLTCTFEKACA